MSSEKAERLQHGGESVEAPALDEISNHHVSAVATPPAQSLQIIRADLCGLDRCSALGITANSAAPVLALCRKLIEAGCNPASSLEVFRGDVLALKRISSIGEAGRLTVEEDRHGRPRFRRWRDRKRGCGGGS